MNNKKEVALTSAARTTRGEILDEVLFYFNLQR
jgi:hypothetical protein